MPASTTSFDNQNVDGRYKPGHDSGIVRKISRQKTKENHHGQSRPYGATTITGGDSDGSRQPSDNELAGARYQGRVIAETAKKLHS
jgi:hypothetical protein